MSASRQRSDKKKQDIRAAAVRLFQQYPPNKVSIRDIAAEANVSMVTIYNHFANKNGLILDLVRQIVESQMKEAKTIMESKQSFQEKISRLLFSKSQSLSDFHPDFMKYILSDPKIQQYLDNLHANESVRMIRTMIEQGRQEGFIAADLPDSLIMNMIELFRKDLTSQESLLLAGCSSPQDYGKIAEVLVYGISGKKPLP